ncbi:MAG: prepilin peptidase [Gemmatimonadetes bacterium]|jgi:leader peptidase (prepilin peptidase)/N-methyltransferase|nr:prepilin peptidase [Gemmatimonadota bacterium]MCZ6825212.1 prepilin peptidase [Gemmatimonadota bacterium]
MTVETIFYVTAGLLGAAIGSFMNVCVHRLPHGESVVRPRSHCPSCGTDIPARDNIPILSWLLLRGRCRGCGERISLRYPLVELVSIGIWVGMALAYGPTLHALSGAVFFTLLLAIAITDARHYVIPDELSIGGLASGLALAVVTELTTGMPTIVSSVVGAALGFLLLLGVGLVGDWVFKKPAMGGGDMKMMAMIGAYLGPIGAILTIFLGALAGSLIFGPISLKTGKMVPFGVFLALGAAATFLLGDALIDWYRGTFLHA